MSEKIQYRVYPLAFNDIDLMKCFCGQRCTHVGSLSSDDMQMKELCCKCYQKHHDSDFTYRCLLFCGVD